MRTTLDLDERVVAAARSKARHEGISLGRAVSDLALAGLEPRGVELIERRNGFPVLDSPPGWVITDEMVYAALEED
ncbi:MAG TPA: DUF2191 domain-containing protein [Marmoricola sp.]